MEQKPFGRCENAPAATGVPFFEEALPLPQDTDTQSDPSAPPSNPLAEVVSSMPSLPGTGRDTLFALLFLACGYLFCRLILEPMPGMSVTVFFCLFSVASLFYLRPSIPLPKGSACCFLLTGLAALQFSVYSSHDLQPFLLLFLIAGVIYCVAILCRNRLEEGLNGFFLVDMAVHVFYVPFHNFFCNFRILFTRKSRKSKTALAVLVGVLIAIPLLAIIVSQLISADAAFESVTSTFLAWLSTQFAWFFIWLIPSFLVGCYLFGLLYGNRYQRGTNRITIEHACKARSAAQVLPIAAFATTLGLVCAVYLFFLIVQVVSVVQSLYSGGPLTVSYADYARRGFFELCGLSFFNLIIMAAAWLFTRCEGSRPLAPRILFAVLSIETILLIFTAVCKMLLYVKRYGLTPKRVYTLWFMAVLFLLFLFVLIAQFRTLPLLRMAALLCSISFLILCYANTDGLIVRYNISVYESGMLEELDVDSFYAMPAGAVPQAAQLYDCLPAGPLKEEVGKFLRQAKRQLSSEDWRSWSIQRLTAANTQLPKGL